MSAGIFEVALLRQSLQVVDAVNSLADVLAEAVVSLLLEVQDHLHYISNNLYK